MSEKYPSAELPTEHSPFGGSSVHHYLACPGSINMSKGIKEEGGESEYAIEGKAAHSLAALCLARNEDAWIYIGKSLENFTVNANMTEAVQVYLNVIRDKHVSGCTPFIEYAFHAKGIHKEMYGRADYVSLFRKRRHLDVMDYKHGIGIVVDAKFNPQTLFYAVGMLEHLNLWSEVDTITTYIVQPRAFHPDGPIRHFTYTTVEVAEWLSDTLIPAMELASVSRDTVAGGHCRFCPARQASCPAMMRNLEELGNMTQLVNDKGGAAALTPAELGHVLDIQQIAKIQEKAARATTLARLNKDNPVPGWKLVSGKTSRQWKEGAIGMAFKEYKSQAFRVEMVDIAAALIKADKVSQVGKLLNVDTIKSPAQLEKLPGGTEFCARWAFKPPAPRTIAPATDVRRGLSTSTKAKFKPVPKKEKA